MGRGRRIGDHDRLLVALAAVPDPRDPRGTRYPLVSMLAVAVCAVLAGACTFAAITDWVRDLDRPAWGRLGWDAARAAGAVHGTQPGRRAAPHAAALAPTHISPRAGSAESLALDDR